MDAGTLTVGQLATGIDAALASWFAGEIWVQGEISSLRRSNTGHVYFQLVERADGEHRADASIDVALFDAARRYVNSQLTAAGGVRMTDGMQVRIRGRLEFYAPQGRVQLRMSGIDASFTLALLLTERDRVIGLLAADGLLECNGELMLATVPLRVGLVTSDGSAAMADFMDELDASGFAWRVTITHVPVQGRDADRRIAYAVDQLTTRDLDVIAIVRGGGSRLDLATFDSELIGRAIARSTVPVFTGIGHEIDVSVADLIAHSGLKTPTACAAALVDRARTGHERAERVWASIREIGPVLARAAQQGLRETAAGVTRLTQSRLDLASHRLDGAWRQAIDRAEGHVARAQASSALAVLELGKRPYRVLDRSSQDLTLAGALVRGSDPSRLMERGWSVTRTATGSVVQDAAQVSVGERLSTTLANGSIESAVTSTDVEREEQQTHGS